MGGLVSAHRGEPITKKVDAFADLTDEQHAELGRRMDKLKTYPKGCVPATAAAAAAATTTAAAAAANSHARCRAPSSRLPSIDVCHQGDHGDHMFFVLSGALDVIVNGTCVAEMGANAAFGEMALLNPDGKRTCTIRTNRRCRMYRLTRQVFQEVIKEGNAAAAKKLELYSPEHRREEALLHELDDVAKSHTSDEHVRAKFLIHRYRAMTEWAEGKRAPGASSISGLAQTCSAVHSLVNHLSSIKDKHAAALLIAEHILMAMQHLRSISDAGAVAVGRMRKDIEHQVACFGKIAKHAIDALESILLRKGNFESTCADAHYELGHLLIEWGEWDAAEATYREVANILPDHCWSHLTLGHLARNRRDDLEGAKKCYRDAIEADPTFALAHLHLGDALLDPRQLNVDDAEASFRVAIAADKHLGDAHVGLATLLAEHRGKLAEAMKAYRHVLSFEPKNAAAKASLDSALKRMTMPGASAGGASRSRLGRLGHFVAKGAHEGSYSAEAADELTAEAAKAQRAGEGEGAGVRLAAPSNTTEV